MLHKKVLPSDGKKQSTFTWTDSHNEKRTGHSIFSKILLSRGFILVCLITTAVGVGVGSFYVLSSLQAELKRGGAIITRSI